ncbi:hypothetical protein QA596_01000 [Balneolales bacterium ANBcel1]|nr:hypothetical protein [Balneolales bacterium ANBcel1]
MHYPPLLLSLLIGFMLLLLAPAAGVVTGGTGAVVSIAQTPAEPDREEVFLSFRFRGVGDVVIIGMYSYDTDRIYLPTTELFDLLEIYYQLDSQNLRLHGHYLETDRPYEIHFQNRTATLDGEQTAFTADDMLIDELDFYLLPEVFDEVFGLEFTVDMSGLVVRLNTTDIMPVVRRIERERRRARAELGVRERRLFPQEFERDRQLLGGGFLDYSLTGNITDQYNSYSYTASIGAEFLGGDVQGNLFGSWSEMSSSFTTSGLRWRYAIHDQPAITQIRLGQHRTEGPQSRQFRGVHLTNQPIEPRRTLDEFVFRGTAPPQSEVELFINNRLIDFVEVDELGNYRFSVPLTYGSSNVRIMIYEPDGRIREEDQRIQVPFTFLPPGEFTYHLSGGQMDQPVFGAEDDSGVASAELAYGATNWMTVRLGSEYLTEVHDVRPHLYAGISSRIMGRYLANIDIAPEAYYRLSASVVYPNSMSWDASYTYYAADDGLYNIGRYDYEARANLFIPIEIGPVPFNFRVGGDRQDFGTGSTNRLRADLGMRLGRVNLRGGFRNTYRMLGSDLQSTDGSIRTTASYSAPRARSIPAIIRGTYLRGQLDYSMRRDQFERLDLQISRNIFGGGRLRFTFSRNLVTGFNTIEGGLSFDLNRTRSTSTARTSRQGSSFRQNFRGSIGYDDYHNRLVLENRQQVGRSAASIRLFTDNNNSGTFDEGDELIRANAVRLDRSGQSRLHNDGVIRVTQLQQYYRNNLMVNVGAIPNPMLVPVIREFSFVSDPNRFKPMDIPFYMSGVIEGMVQRREGETERGLGGVRVMLRQVDGDFRETMRTFSDGSYYAMEIPPGRYEAWVDTTQQNFLNARSEPPVLQFEVQALAHGDFLEGLNIMLLPREAPEPEPEPDPEPEWDEEQLARALAGQSMEAIRLYVSAQEAFYRGQFGASLELIDASLERYETDYGLALKGSLLFVHGRREAAQQYWDRAAERSPELEIPDVEELERIIQAGENGDFDFSEIRD